MAALTPFDGSNPFHLKAPAGWSDLAGSAGPGSPPADWPERPSVLLDDMRIGRAARLYTDPMDVIAAWSVDEVTNAMAMVQDRVAQGHHAAGFLAYEAGAAFEPALAAGPFAVSTDTPLLWFGIFGGYYDVKLAHPPPDRGPALRHVPDCSSEIYAIGAGRVLEFIEAGDCYQINLTFANDVSLSAPAWETYISLRARQRSGWGGYLNTGMMKILSCSPELFFTQHGQCLMAKPMKGTAPRSADPALDKALRQQLENSTKDRAENLMIVDLLRNDLGRIAVPGSVKVPALFDIEAYPTVYQMTSTVVAAMRDGVDSIDVLSAMFPCGSVTGAPKVRAMEIISLLEARARGAYTGSMGFIDPGGTSAFNVLIRSLEIADDVRPARLGLGSAIVADSSPASEWEECIAKAAFLRPR